jgi:hypothetical protein
LTKTKRGQNIALPAKLKLSSVSSSSSAMPNLLCPDDDAASDKYGWKDNPLTVSEKDGEEGRGALTDKNLNVSSNTILLL